MLSCCMLSYRAGGTFLEGFLLKSVALKSAGKGLKDKPVRYADRDLALKNRPQAARGGSGAQEKVPLPVEGGPSGQKALAQEREG